MNSYSLNIRFRHERAQDGEVLIHLLAAVSLDGNVRHSLSLGFFLVLAHLGPPPPLLAALHGGFRRRRRRRVVGAAPNLVGAGLGGVIVAAEWGGGGGGGGRSVIGVVHDEVQELS